MDWRTSLGAAANQHFKSAFDQLFATLQRCDPHGDQQANGNLCTQTAQSLWAKAKSLDDFQKKVHLKCNKIQSAAAPSPSVVPSAAPAPVTPQPFVQQQYAATPQQQQVQVQQHLVPQQQVPQQQVVQQQQQYAGQQTGAMGNRFGVVMPQQQQQQPQQAYYAAQQQQQHAQVHAVYSQQKHQQPAQAAQPSLQVPYVPPPTQQRGGAPSFGDNSLYAPRAPAAVTTQGYAMASQATVANGYGHSGGWPQQQVQVPAQSAATASYTHQGAAMKRKHDTMSAVPSPYVQHQPQQHASVTRTHQQQQAPAFVQQQQQQQQAMYNMNHVNGSAGVVPPQQARPPPDRRELKRSRTDGSGLAATGGMWNGGAGATPAPQLQPPQPQVSSTPADVNAHAGQEVRQPTRKDLFMQNQELFVWLLKNHKLIPDDQGGKRTDGTSMKSLALTFVQGIMRREKLDSPVNDATLKLYARVVKEVDHWRKVFGAYPTPVAGAAAVPTVPPAPQMQQPPPQQSFTQHSVATTSSTVPPQPLPHMPAHAQPGPGVQQMRQAPTVVKQEPQHAQQQQQQQPPPPLPQQRHWEQRTAAAPPPTFQQQPLPPPPQPLAPIPPPIKKEPSMPMPLSFSVSRLETSELDLDSLDDLAGPVGFVAPAPVQTLPEAAVGHVSRWDAPLNDLRDILADSKKPFVLNPPPDRPGQPRTKEQERQEARRAVVNRATQALSNLPALMQSMMERTGLPVDSQGDLGAGPLLSRVRAAFNGALVAMTRSPEQGQQDNEPAGLAAALSMFKRADDLLHELRWSVVPEAAREGGKARHHPERRRHIVEGVLRDTLADEIGRVEQLQSSWVMRLATSDGDVRSVEDLIEALRGLKQLRDFELSAQGLTTLAAAYGKGVWRAEVLLEVPSGGSSLRAVHVEVVVNGAPQSAWSEKMGDVARTALLGWRRVCKGDVVRTMAGLLDELREKVELGRCEMTGRALKLDMLTMELSPPFAAPPSSIPGSHGLAFPLKYRAHCKFS